MIGYAKAGLEALEAAGLLTKLLLAAGLVAGLITAYGVWHHEVYERGYHQALSDIAAEDAKAIGKASEMRSLWKECRTRNGTWVQSTGECR